ncbi:MAG: Glucose-6-phosphate isomerase [Candidatus Ordinivivax streblomastigis]|uniref:glucose-6-phosphate isomerase n=1 Tax=Candidatus Ordinivivax streblomastigis TaxID=2540710 RepID=A0A5M8NWR1_9BACT|nr:MAG: Glucose-6-phosphate isomerase [Candidatus Ordinivivax streblomastigis]
MKPEDKDKKEMADQARHDGAFYEIQKPEVFFDSTTGKLLSEQKVTSRKELQHLAGVFADETKRLQLDQSRIVYEVESYFPVADGKKGGLFWGVTKIHPGKVGDEYFMTRGHFHANADTAEFYWGITGEGVLIRMDKDGNSSAEQVRPHSLHYIAGCVAHRVVNTGNEPLVFGACWLSDAGHDYETIAQKGFSVRLLEKEGKPIIVKSE